MAGAENTAETFINKISREKVKISDSFSSFGSLSMLDQSVRKLLLHSNDVSKCRENPLTLKGKRIQLAKILLLVLLPIISLAVLAVLDLKAIAQSNSVDLEIRNVIRFSRDIGVLLSRLQRERDMTALYVSLIGPQDISILTEIYPQTDNAIEELKDWPVETSILNELPFFREKSDFKQHLVEHRKSVTRSDTAVYDEVNFYTDILQIFIDWLYESIGNSEGSDLWQVLVAYQLLIVSNVETGIERTLGSVFYTLGGFERHEDYVWYMEKYNLGIWNYEASKKYSSLITEFFDNHVLGMSENFTDTIVTMRKEILVNEASKIEPKFIDAKLWFDSMSVYIDILEDVQKNMANQILLLLEDDLKNDTEAIAVSILLVVVVIVMCPLTLRAIWSLTSDIQNYALTLAAQTKALNREKKRSSWLLYSMLPPTVAEQLVQKRDVKAESYNSATVLFSDIAGFNHLCALSTPMQVVEMLNGLYLVFDSRIEQYNVYKVETVNETYMLASGLPDRMVGGEHVRELATVALDLLHHVSFLEVPHRENMKIKIRIGIHTGPVVAGVVGIKMPRYCLFGDTVNTASRMQTSGLPGRIHISNDTYMALVDIGGFMVVRRGEIEIKGKGIMCTYWLTGRENLEQIIPSITEVSNIKNDPGLHEVRYAHMYEQTSTGRIQYRGKDDEVMVQQEDWNE
ncbi:uncharacterized protein [Asterias amurensis]|uniref:uncharacterized protein n=1 Tax=Asterias amurensis TaxID=7602 RepID=UPI003AB35B8F